LAADEKGRYICPGCGNKNVSGIKRYNQFKIRLALD
jgi:hypothetical protein